MIRRSPISSDDGGGHRYAQGEARLTWPTSYPAPRRSRPISSAAASLRRAITTSAIPHLVSGPVRRRDTRARLRRHGQRGADAARPVPGSRRRLCHGYRVVGWPS